MIRHTGFHPGCNPQRFMNPHKIIVGEMERHGSLKILQILTESVCKPGEAPHLHPHG
jgi:hypothetical protein